jgi:ADP-heptose:LPS heptosyltransferase
VQRILLIRAGALGDTLMATPVVPALAQRYPGARIDFLASEAASALLRGVPDVGEVLPLRQRNVPYWLSLEKMRLVRRIRRARYDLAVVLEHAARYYELVERARVPRVVGFRNTPFNPALHSIANNLRAAGFDNYDDLSWKMLIAPVAGEYPRPHGLFEDRRGPLVGMHVGYGPGRRKRNQEQRLRGWALENFAAVGSRLIDTGARIVLTGSQEDRGAVDRLRALLPESGVFDAAGRLSLRESVALIRDLDLLVSVDSGPAHIAAALGTPLVVLWGPGILEQTRPVSVHGRVEIVREVVGCAPCYGTPLMKACRRNICMEGITPDRVVAAVDRVLGERSVRVRPSPRPPA